MKNKSSTRVQKIKVYTIINNMSMSVIKPYIMYVDYMRKVYILYMIIYIIRCEIIILESMNTLFQYNF